MRYLKSIKLSFCDGLTRIPNLSGLKSLEYLKLSYCKDLVEVDPSIGRLDKLAYLKLSACGKLQMFLKRINLKSLETLSLSDCPLKFFPEIEEDMKSLKHLDLRRTDIKELPCSVGNLTGLKSLSLLCCDNLTNVPSSIFYELQCLEDLDLTSCSNLVTFPTKSESLPPPVFSTIMTRLQVHLDYCRRLEEISEFPREIDFLSLDGCRSLETISKLSRILEGKDSKMFGRLDLTDCWRLCGNLARRLVSKVEVDKRLFNLAKKRNKMTSSPFAGTKELMGEAEKFTALLTLFFSCAKSEEFQVQFPSSAWIPIPNWFTSREDVNWDVKWDENGDVEWDVNWDVSSEVIIIEHEFRIEIPQNSNWDNKGLALCIQPCVFEVTHFLYINGMKFDEKFMSRNKGWVHYIPFVTIIRRLSECGMPPPNMFRVMFRFKDNRINHFILEGSWGVHLIEDLEGEGR